MEKFTKIFFTALFLMTISSCDRKSCSKVVCPSYQGCYQGECICFNGYEGINCATISSTKFTGNWTILSENCGAQVTPPFPTGYSVYIVPDPTSVSHISISNLLNTANTATAELYNTYSGSEGTQVHIFAQNLGGIAISDSYGSYNTSNGNPQLVIVLNYSYNSFNYSCQETFTKQ